MDIKITSGDDGRFNLYIGNESVGGVDTLEEAIHYAEAMEKGGEDNGNKL